MRRLSPTGSRVLLVAWMIASFTVSAITHWPTLVGCWMGAVLLLRRGCVAPLRRTLLTAAPLTAFFVAAGILFDVYLVHRPPPYGAYATVFLRATLATFLAFSVLSRVDLLGALAPYPTATRLVVITLAQIHALRLLIKESRLGLRSRLLRKPSTRDVLRGSGAISAHLFAVAARNARDTGDAMRSRGF